MEAVTARTEDVIAHTAPVTAYIEARTVHMLHPPIQTEAAIAHVEDTTIKKCSVLSNYNNR